MEGDEEGNILKCLIYNAWRLIIYVAAARALALIYATVHRLSHCLMWPYLFVAQGGRLSALLMEAIMAVSMMVRLLTSGCTRMSQL